ncbi:inverse autotransporter beta domain-containing protein [Xenorhabdus khoisanae]|uniref:inverse autotransporter beta domain-containing protein n=1 Tax=Xenorhabdus khoisanae TaxID=880157 RepID=UPI002358E99E|nr:inverse autotransporter beta domain-containing protein [Xenorhabdus khoisanae]MDC9616085.1 inverse autotransporter beta domain-containing protein [Xenorhabdus khoisanae]
MDSSINHKVFRFSVLLYSLFLPFTPTSAFSAGEKNQESSIEKKRFLQRPANENHADKERDNQATIDQEAGGIVQNIHKATAILSSSPSQLTEQAKSYALGKINGAISTEAQKWLSGFGTARINFSLDKKGKLDNSSLDLLLPFYDNKADWLFFSQLGYRHKDSRHTLNLGLGGRYFTPNWMYGLNTFFDNDVTGKNKRLGFGGEVWTDYAKFSANTYWRLSKWHQSPNERDYEERPANGYDINGEFFLPAYPNLGGKLSYEQYFGDNVALFNRNTKQKDPNLARIGLNYTPVPLMTMGVDYKLGSSGHSETLFLANLNYRFGVPFGVQISPGSVAFMRTLAGSRHDLVERNNDIVLDYQKKPEFNLSLPNVLSGYSAQHVTVTPTITAEKLLRKIIWQPNEAFSKRGGAFTPRDKSVELNLPKYVVNGINNFTLSAMAEVEGSNKLNTTQMNVVIDPFAIKDQSIKPSGKGPVIANGKPAYDLTATVTYGDKSNPPIKNTAIPNIKWSIDPPDQHATLNWDPSGMTNDAGQLAATLSSTQPIDPKTKVYLEMDNQPKLEIKGDKPFGFTNLSDAIHADDFVLDNKPPFEATDQKPVIVTATVFDTDGNPINKKMEMDLQWKTEPANLPGLTIKPAPGYENSTDKDGKIKAIVTSTQAVKEVKAGVLVNNKHQNFSKPFNFVVPENLKFLFDVITQSSTGGNAVKANGQDRYTFKVRVLDEASKSPLKNQSLRGIKWTLNTITSNLDDVTDKVNLEVPENPITDSEGYLTLYMTSKIAIQGIFFRLYTGLSTDTATNSRQSSPVAFDAVAEPVGILLGIQGSSNKMKYFSQQERPYNVHDNVVVKLTKNGTDDLFADSALTNRPTLESSNDNVVKVNTSDGTITFNKDHFSDKGVWPVTVKLTVYEPQWAITSVYSYTFNPQRYLFIRSDHPTVKLNLGNDFCALGPPKATNDTQKTPTVYDIGARPETTIQTSFSLEYDKETFPDFGFDKLNGKYWKLDDNRSDIELPSYYAYDYQNRVFMNGSNQISGNTQVIMMCQISSVY